LLSATISILVKKKDVKQKMKKKKNKMTYKQMVTLIFGMQQQIEDMKQQVYIGEKALDEYVKMKGDKDDFITHLEEKYNTDDKDNEKTEGK
tara:strand:+ start:6595 stop:6867 length:273 start_codon:yes stop_codon:yes gene_type:complete